MNANENLGLDSVGARINRALEVLTGLADRGHKGAEAACGDLRSILTGRVMLLERRIYGSIDMVSSELFGDWPAAGYDAAVNHVLDLARDDGYEVRDTDGSGCSLLQIDVIEVAGECSCGARCTNDEIGAISEDGEIQCEACAAITPSPEEPEIAEEADLELRDEPLPEDYHWTNTGNLGGAILVTQGGGGRPRVIYRGTQHDEACGAIALDMEAQQFWQPVWQYDDHGGVTNICHWIDEWRAANPSVSPACDVTA